MRLQIIRPLYLYCKRGPTGFQENLRAQISARGCVPFFMRKKFLLLIALQFVDILQMLRLVRLDSKIRETIVKSGSRYNSVQDQMKGRMPKKMYSQRPTKQLGASLLGWRR